MLAALLASLALVAAAPQGSPSPSLSGGGADSAYPAPTDNSGLSTQLHPNGNPAKCVDVAGSKFQDGTSVQM